MPGKVAHPVLHDLDVGDGLLGDGRDDLLDLLRSQLEALRRPVVEAFRVLANCSVTTQANICDDLGDSLANLVVRTSRTGLPRSGLQVFGAHVVSVFLFFGGCFRGDRLAGAENMRERLRRQNPRLVS
jgi:hypothetical protein